MLRNAIAVVSCVIGLAAFGATSHARALLHLPPARAPCSVLSGHPCHPSFCGVFHRGPCFPYYLPPLGQDLRLTIVSTDDNDPTGKLGGDADKSGGDVIKTVACRKPHARFDQPHVCCAARLLAAAAEG